MLTIINNGYAKLLNMAEQAEKRARYDFKEEILIKDDGITILSHNAYFNLNKREMKKNKYLTRYIKQTQGWFLDDELMEKWKKGTDLKVLNRYCEKILL